jgi:asparagine synthase (glutamine-hydrolysing)
VFRYVTLVWDDRSIAAARQASVLAAAIRQQKRAWRSVLNAAGVQVWCAGSRPGFLDAHVLLRDEGVILGRIFRRDGAAGGTHITSTSERARGLIADCWGRYIAVLVDADARRTWILRDPSGAMRCFHATSQGVHLICSDVEDLAALGLRFTINWNYVAAELANCAAMGWEQTGLRELSAVKAGEALEISESGARTCVLWDPAAIAASPLKDAAEGAQQVRHVVRRCLHAWAGCQSRVAMLLSGGLDSSIVLACLQDAPVRPAIACLNYFHRPAKSDERAYARLMAKRAACDLVELERSTEVPLEALLHLPPSARPSHNRLDQVLHAERTAAWATGAGAGVIFTGDLGDQLFGQQLTRFASVDCARVYGAGRRLLAVSRDLARMTHLGIWTPLARGLAIGWMSRSARLRRLATRLDRRDTNPYVDSCALDRLDYRLLHRWLDSASELPLGKLHHIASVLSGQAYLTPIGNDDDPDWAAPLNSQPIIEICLRLPLYVLTQGGWDRALLRRAFAADLPEQIAWRHTKGTSSTQRVAVYSRNAPFLRDLLLGGVLAGSGLLDLVRLEKDLREEDYRKNMWLERCIRAETWLRIWNAVPAPNPTYMSRSARYVYSRAS